MNQTFTVRRALSAGLAAFAALTLAAGCGQDADSGAEDDETTAAADYNDADVTFAQMMIPHHEQAVEMSALAAEHAEDPEITALAEQIAAAQQPEIDTLTGWLETWGEPVEMDHGDHAMEGMIDKAQMSELEAAHGTEFDKLFAELMIAHHQGAITMAEEEQAEGQNPEAIELAGAIIEAQTTEIATLQTILDRL